MRHHHLAFAISALLLLAGLTLASPAHAQELRSGSYQFKAEQISNSCAEAQTLKLAKQREARQEVRASNGDGSGRGRGKIATSLESLARARTRFGCVLVDPPWRYGNQGTRASTDNHYDTLSVEEIAAMPVGELAAESSHLHLWTTNAFLFDAKGLMEDWGFTYKSMLVWVKPEMGLGNYWRVSHEFLLLGVRGRAPFRSKSHRSWFEESRAEHSAKPETSIS